MRAFLALVILPRWPNPGLQAKNFTYGRGCSTQSITVPNISNLRKTIGSYLGQVLTPEMAAEIELAAHDGVDASYDPAQFGQLVRGEFTFQAERFHEIVSELHVLHQEHWLETEKHRHGLTLDPDYANFLADERAGRLIQFTVRKGDALVGNLRMYVHQSRHTKRLVASEDTLYLTPACRGGLTAITLMRFAEAALLSIGVSEIEADSKLVNNADVLMRRMKYTPVAIKFSKVFEG